MSFDVKPGFHHKHDICNRCQGKSNMQCRKDNSAYSLQLLETGGTPSSDCSSSCKIRLLSNKCTSYSVCYLWKWFTFIFFEKVVLVPRKHGCQQ